MFLFIKINREDRKIGIDRELSLLVVTNTTSFIAIWNFVYFYPIAIIIIVAVVSSQVLWGNFKLLLLFPLKYCGVILNYCCCFLSSIVE